jgi:hypothetical protein
LPGRRPVGILLIRHQFFGVAAKGHLYEDRCDR